MTGADHDLAPPTSTTDDMLDEIGRLQARQPRGSIRDPAQVVRGRGLGQAQTFQDVEPSEISPDQGLGDVPDDFEPLEDVPLLSTPSDPGPDRDWETVSILES